MKKFTAFTLSEVLVTVGIIGVISALTVPALVRNYQEEAQAVQLRKVFSEIESAIDMLITEEGKTSLASTSIARDNGVDNFIKTHLKTIKTCDSSNTNECFANENYLPISGNGSKTFTCSGNSYILANSAAICASKTFLVDIDGSLNGEKLENASRQVKGVNIELYIDINGSKEPNIGGRDMFHVFIQPDGRIYDQALYEDFICGGNPPVCLFPGTGTHNLPNCVSDAFGSGCFARLLDNNWKMNY